MTVGHLEQNENRISSWRGGCCIQGEMEESLLQGGSKGREAGQVWKTGPTVLAAFLQAESEAKRVGSTISLHSVSQMPGSYLR